MTQQWPLGKRTARRGLLAALVIGMAPTLAACGSSGTAASSQATGFTHDRATTLVVWTDSIRLGGFQTEQKKHPEVKMRIQVYDPSTLLSKIQLANRTGKGWPDVVYDSVPGDVASLASSTFGDFAQDLTNLVPKNIQRGFGGTDDACIVDGKLSCLRQSIAQDVIWYNKPLMQKFGYKIPTTWAQYEQLGEQVASQHPGYIIGTAGYQTVWDDYMFASGCPLAEVTSPNHVTINALDPRCTRVTDMLDALIADGSVSRDSQFDPSVVKLGQEQKILMMPAASWYGDFVFEPANSYNTPNGVLAAAAMPKWDGQSQAWSGAQGGGIYLVSRHSKDVVDAAALAQWVSTDPDVLKGAPTYPGYLPAATVWGQHLATSGFYAVNPFPVIQAQATLINSVNQPVRYSVDQVVTQTLIQSVRSGGTLKQALPQLQSQLVNLARAAGYQVATS
jgi:ABC-type glycerol-3-phosphate transport system substrate-binding protein